MSTPVTARLAGFACAPLDGSIPREVAHAGRRTIVNALAVGAGAARHPAVEIALRSVELLEPAPRRCVLGRRERLSPQWAAFVNGVAIHVEDYDDTHLASMIHPGAPVVAAALASAEHAGASGQELLEAVLVGAEVALRVGVGIGPEPFDRGWHPTGTIGHLGAAAAAGRLLGLDDRAMRWALGIAVTEAAGLQAALGSMTKALHPGKAASDGVEAALLAARGFTGPSAGIEGRRGLIETTAPNANPELIVRGLGQEWRVLENTFKPYACGIVAHPSIDAAVALREPIAGRSIRAIHASVNPVVLEVMGHAEPTNGLESKFSIHHCIAVGLLDGAAGPDQFRDERVLAADVRALRSIVSVDPEPSFARDRARLRIDLEGDGMFEREVHHATGSRMRPMSDVELARKAETVVRPVLGRRAASLVELAFAVDELKTMGPLVDALLPDEEDLDTALEKTLWS